MSEKAIDNLSRRRTLQLCAVSGGFGLSATGVTAGAGGRREANELHLVESGVRYRTADDDLDLSLRMPVDFAPKYWTGADGIMPTPQASETERRLLVGADGVVANGTVNPVGRQYGGASNRGHLPLQLRGGRQPVDAALVKEDVVHPRYSIHREGRDVAVTTSGGTDSVGAGERAELTFPARTYTVVTHDAVATDELTSRSGEGDEAVYRHEKRTVERRFVPTLSVRNRGTVTVWQRGNAR